MVKAGSLKGDVFGGLTAGIVALPLALAFGIQSGLGAEAGLYGAIILGFFAAIFGGTKTQISGPTGPMTVVAAATIAGFFKISGNMEVAIAAIVACFILAGAFQIIMGLIKMGTLIKFIPYPVISGFMSGIGVIIILLQLFPAMGQPAPSNTIEVVRTILPALDDANLWAVFYTALTIGIIYIFPKITKAIPGTLAALIAVTIISIFITTGVPVIGNIPTGLPPFRGDDLFHISADLIDNVILAAATLAALGSIDSLLTSVVADNVTKTKHDSNKELIGQGIGNMASGLFGGLPGAGATMRTLVNIRSGGTGRLSGILHSVVLAVILLAIGKYAALIPISVLAGVLITVGIGILDYKGIRHITKVPRADAWIMVIVLLVTVFLNLLTAVGIGMVMAAFFFMKKMSDLVEEKTKIMDIGLLQTEADRVNQLPVIMEGKVIIKELDGPLFFGFASGFLRMAEKFPDVRFLVIKMAKVPFMDQSGLYALEEVVLSMERRGIEVLLVCVNDQIETMLRRINIIPDLVSEENVYKNFDDSMAWVREKVSQKP
jgi:sulfate permease, SulP family